MHSSTTIVDGKAMLFYYMVRPAVDEPKFFVVVGTSAGGIRAFCPDCSGRLYVTQKEHPTHYRFHVGQSFTDRELLIRISDVMENTFCTSLRILEEQRALLLKLAKKDEERGYTSTAKRHTEKEKEIEGHIENSR